MIKLENDQIQLVAARVNYEGSGGIAEASGDVILTVNQFNLRLETDRLTYDPGNGEITIPGKVHLVSAQADLMVDTFHYNVKTETGTGGAIHGTILDVPRNFLISGKSLQVQNGVVTFREAELTRCIYPTSEYVLMVRQASLDKDVLYLHGIFLKFLGVPVGYYPSYKIKTGQDGIENPLSLSLGYNTDDGVVLNFSVTPQLNDNLDWSANGTLSSQGDSLVGAGLGVHLNEYLADRVNLGYDFQKSSFIVFNTINLNYRHPLANLMFNYDHYFYGGDDNLSFSVARDGGMIGAQLDGMREFSSTAENQLGLTINRKFQRGWLGDWQYGIMARHVSKLDETGYEYGGTYGGYHVDFRPNPYLTLSYLRLDSYSGGDYRDFEPNLGSSGIYNINLPLKQKLTLGIGGTYNFTDAAWKSRIYQLNYASDCYSIQVGWDTVTGAWNLTPTFNF